MERPIRSFVVTDMVLDRTDKFLFAFGQIGSYIKWVMGIMIF